jgi:hypothetical protein
VTGGPHKVVFNEGVCASARFLGMNLNETNRVVVDNSKHSEGQTGLTVTLTKFPVRVKGEVPPNSTIGDVVSTIVLSTPPGEERSVDLVPTFTGTYTATCGVAIRQAGSSTQIQQTDIDVQIK